MRLLHVDVHRHFEDFLHAYTFSKEEIEVGHLGLEIIRRSLLLPLDDDWNLIEQALHETAYDHEVV